MGDEREYDPQPEQNPIPPEQPFDQIKRVVSLGASEAQKRFKDVFGKASTYLQPLPSQSPVPQQATTLAEQHLRQLVNRWSNESWRVARDLGSNFELISWSSDEIWDVTLSTRWESRNLEIANEPYNGRGVGNPQPLLPVWDYQLPPVVGLKAPEAHFRLEGLDEIVSCNVCNATGRVFCNECTGRGWNVCSECKGRTKKRCPTCRGRSYIEDWAQKEKQSFFKKQAGKAANTVGGKVADVFDTIRDKGVPIPNIADRDPASKGKNLIPCPDCVAGEVDCSCGNGKRVCTKCQGAKTSLCTGCSGTGKIVRHCEIVRQFTAQEQSRYVGELAIPAPQLHKAEGELIFNAEIDAAMQEVEPPERVPHAVWHLVFEMIGTDLQQSEGQPALDPRSSKRPTLQVVEIVRVPFTKVQYRFGNQEYLLYIYDIEGHEKFFADQYPSRWGGIERFVKSVSQDFLTTTQKVFSNKPVPPFESGSSPYMITEERQKKRTITRPLSPDELEDD